MAQDDINIRMMQEYEKDLVINAARRSFSYIIYVLFRVLYLSNRLKVLVAEQEGDIVGGSALSVVNLGSHQVGLVDFIFLIPEATGQGLGPQLLKSSEAYFEQRGIKEYVAFVDGYNSPSWKMFHRQDYYYLSLREQLALWGWKAFEFWFKSLYFKEIGHFMLVKNANKRLPAIKFSPLEIGFTLLALSFFGWWALRGRGISFWLMLILLTLHILIYELMEVIIARHLGYQTEFRVWGNSITVNFILLLIPGFFLPAFGSIYLADPEYNYKKRPSPKGKMAAGALLAGFLMAVIFSIFARLYETNFFVNGAFFSWFYYTFQAVLIFSPLKMFKGQQLKRWQPKFWYISLLGWILLTGLLFL